MSLLLQNDFAGRPTKPRNIREPERRFHRLLQPCLRPGIYIENRRAKDSVNSIPLTFDPLEASETKSRTRRIATTPLFREPIHGRSGILPFAGIESFFKYPTFKPGIPRYFCCYTSRTDDWIYGVGLPRLQVLMCI
jgi:hypothetical protein